MQVTTPAPEKDAAKAEKERLLTLILKNAMPLTQDYKNLIKHTGGLLQTSMGYAYSKGIQDVIKLLTKEEGK
jgi:hypothetical protein